MEQPKREIRIPKQKLYDGYELSSDNVTALSEDKKQVIRVQYGLFGPVVTPV